MKSEKIEIGDIVRVTNKKTNNLISSGTIVQMLSLHKTEKECLRDWEQTAEVNNLKYKKIGVTLEKHGEEIKKIREEILRIMDGIIRKEKARCGEANAVTCWNILKERVEEG